MICVCDTFFEGNLNYWFQVNIMADYFIEGNLCWRDVWATTCHWLWYWRNMEQHNNNFMRPTNAGYHILQKVKEYYSSRVVSLVASQVHRSISHIRWKPPRMVG
jgi:hypothetical protein